MTTQSYDTLIIGAGPAGSAAAAVLAEHGRKVLVLEQEMFPRYMIGESMLPYCYFPLERLGLIEAMNASAFVKKYSVQFVGATGNVSQPFYFQQHMDHPASMTWQVLRSEFDTMLADNARARGAEIRHGVTVTDLITDGDGAVTGVLARMADGEETEFHARVTIDASGRRAVSASRRGWRRMDADLKKYAIWTYYEGAMRDPGQDAGATTIAYVDGKNWCWYIPLHDDLVSVGVVGEKDWLFGGDTRDPETIFHREAHKNPWIAAHLGPGAPVQEYRVTGDFSYRSIHCAGDGLVLIGDAFAFLDPVFSSGLFLALHSGVMAADAVHEALESGDVSAARFTDYGARLCQALEAMRKLVHAFYDPRFSFREVMKRNPNVKSDITDCLIGHLHRDFTEMFAAIEEVVPLPAELDYGGPVPQQPT